MTSPGVDGQLADLSLRYLWRSMVVASVYSSECLYELVPRRRRPDVGEPPPIPLLPDHAEIADWSAWYLRYGVWAGHQQAWSARVYQALGDAIASGALRADAVRTSTQLFLDNRLPDYLRDMGEINSDLITDIMAAADRSLRAFVDGYPADPPMSPESPTATETTVEIRGPVGTVGRADLAIENNRGATADVVCAVTPTADFRVSVEPASFRLEPEQTERLGIHVTLPDEATAGSVPAATITIAGYDNSVLIVHVRATAEVVPARSDITIRVLDQAGANRRP